MDRQQFRDDVHALVSWRLFCYMMEDMSMPSLGKSNRQLWDEECDHWLGTPLFDIKDPREQKFAQLLRARADEMTASISIIKFKEVANGDDSGS